MSIRACGLGIEQHLRNVFDDAEGKFVGFQLDGRPPVTMGQKYVAVHYLGSQTAAETPDAEDRSYSFAVTATWKLTALPRDRQAKAAAQEGRDLLLDFIDQVPDLLVENYDVVNLMNALITGFDVQTNGFIEPFHSCSVGMVEDKGADWIGAEHLDHPPTVKSVTATFRGCRRIRVRGTVA